MKTLIIIASVLLTFNSAWAGTIVGSVTFSGDLPKAQTVKADKDQFCMDHFGTQASENLVVDKKCKGIKNIVIYVEGVEGEFEPPEDEEGPTLDQRNCQYHPHVLPVLAGTIVNIHTSDPVNHNVRANAEENEAINWAMPEKDMSLPYEVYDPEVIKFACDIHKWMNAYIVVLENPYFAISNDKGAFKIADVPEGSYKLTAWHEELGTISKDATIPATGEVKMDFSFSPKKK